MLKNLITELLSQPKEVLQLIITPENIEAACRGFGYGFAKGLKENE